MKTPEEWSAELNKRGSGIGCDDIRMIQEDAIKSDPNGDRRALAFLGLSEEKIKKTRKPAKQKVFLKILKPIEGEDWHWTACYFHVGDEIIWCDRKGACKISTVTKVFKNQFGRISYATKEQDLILTEDVQKATGKQTPVTR